MPTVPSSPRASALRVGDRVPSVTVPVRDGAGWARWSTDALFAGRTVVVFSLPGAFTPTCSSSHVPRYEELYEAFRGRGVDEVLCVSVNDSFVMNAWKADQGADKVRFFPDGNGDFTRGMGMLVDKAALGFGPRSWRYAMVVRDGVIDALFVEPEVEGDPFEVSDADTVLRHLGGAAPPDVALVTRPGCAHCERAKAALAGAGLAWTEVPASPRLLRALPGAGTTPQVFVDKQHIGGADELVAWLQGRAARGA